MAVESDGQTRAFFDFPDNLGGRAGSDHACHVLDGDGVASHLLELFRELYKGRCRMNRAGGVANLTAGMLAGLPYG